VTECFVVIHLLKSCLFSVNQYCKTKTERDMKSISCFWSGIILYKN